MESRTVEPDALALSEEEGVSNALREAVEKEMEFLEKRDIKLVRMRSDDEGDVFQVTIHAGDEMYRMSEVAPGHVSRTVFRNPEPDGSMPYQDEAGDGEKEVEEAEKEEGSDEEEMNGEDSTASDGNEEKEELTGDE